MNTAQTVADILIHLADRLYTQKGRCLIDGRCNYVDGQGNHCAVGHLLSSQSWEFASKCHGGVPSLENDWARRKDGSVETLYDEKFFIADIGVRRRLLDSLQFYHDEPSMYWTVAKSPSFSKVSLLLSMVDFLNTQGLDFVERPQSSVKGFWSEAKGILRNRGYHV
ncbi:hypothetical protein [Pseudomonas phage vB_PaeM_PAO1_Ab17]|uniref:Uncharacterized protein n=2 Tax=Nankokuvirus Ab03 TaxID=1925780 RepID=A0A0A1IVQ7_9CAUD|nr:hypothetical protein VC54_gp077 [Pseudomonas phage vB_PaeM_PAO1_Ab03]CEF89239.1 hypothetical protein [Pseudomonas phage vB_PaeM_PAO1_Ab03]CEF89615.1 hypothetical protein [Pseudomonas phage vB_PaeM_PAO1_Ab17]